MEIERLAHTATLLMNGEVLVTGGNNTNSPKCFRDRGIVSVVGDGDPRKRLHTTTLGLMGLLEKCKKPKEGRDANPAEKAGTKARTGPKRAIGS